MIVGLEAEWTVLLRPDRGLDFPEFDRAHQPAGGLETRPQFASGRPAEHRLHLSGFCHRQQPDGVGRHVQLGAVDRLAVQFPAQVASVVQQQPVCLPTTFPVLPERPEHHQQLPLVSRAAQGTHNPCAAEAHYTPACPAHDCQRVSAERVLQQHTRVHNPLPGHLPSQDSKRKIPVPPGPD